MSDWLSSWSRFRTPMAPLAFDLLVQAEERLRRIVDAFSDRLNRNVSQATGVTLSPVTWEAKRPPLLAPTGRGQSSLYDELGTPLVADPHVDCRRDISAASGQPSAKGSREELAAPDIRVVRGCRRRDCRPEKTGDSMGTARELTMPRANTREARGAGRRDSCGVGKAGMTVRNGESLKRDHSIPSCPRNPGFTWQSNHGARRSAGGWFLRSSSGHCRCSTNSGEAV